MKPPCLSSSPALRLWWWHLLIADKKGLANSLHKSWPVNHNSPSGRWYVWYMLTGIPRTNYLMILEICVLDFLWWKILQNQLPQYWLKIKWSTKNNAAWSRDVIICFRMWPNGFGQHASLKNLTNLKPEVRHVNSVCSQHMISLLPKSSHEIGKVMTSCCWYWSRPLGDV